jgi:hypothetical protein
MNAADTSRAVRSPAATSPAARTPSPGATDPARTTAGAARSAGTTTATTAGAPVRPQPSHLTRKIKSGHRVVLPSHLILPPPPVHHLVTPLMPLRTHPMTSSEHLPPMPSPARLERPVG